MVFRDHFPGKKIEERKIPWAIVWDEPGTLVCTRPSETAGNGGQRGRGVTLPTGPQIILTLKVLVASVTVLFVASIVVLRLGRPRLHGRINSLFFVLTMLTVVGFEVLLQSVDVSASFDQADRSVLRVHLWFAIPSAVLLPVMLFTGPDGRKSTHIAFARVRDIVGRHLRYRVFFLPLPDSNP